MTALQRQWAMWEHRGNWKGGRAEYNDLDVLLFECATVEEFWSGYAATPTIQCVAPAPPTSAAVRAFVCHAH